MVTIKPDFSIISRIAESFIWWCVWAYHDRGPGQKPGKLPHKHAGLGGMLKQNEPASWIASIDEAMSIYRANMPPNFENGWSYNGTPVAADGWAGIGVLMSGMSSDMVGIDIDQCLHPDMTIKPEAKDLVNAVTRWGYVEVSPSGTGIRAFIKANLPDWMKKSDGKYLEKTKHSPHGESVEVYSPRSDRFLSLTGKLWADCDGNIDSVPADEFEHFLVLAGFRPPIRKPSETAQDCADRTTPTRTDEELLKLLKTHNKRGRVTRLLDGNASDHGGDHSKADLALCGEIAYFSPDAEQIDRIFRQSGLIRAKWDEKRGSLTYGQRTIDQALKQQTRNFDEDQASKANDKKEQFAKATALKTKGSQMLAGGIDDLLNSKGQLLVNLHTVVQLLIRDLNLAGTVFFNEFSGQPEKLRPLSEALGKSAPNTDGDLLDHDLIALTAYLAQQWRIDLSVPLVKDAVLLWARTLSRNPITERLDDVAAAWDGNPRLQTWLIDYCNANILGAKRKDISRYVQEVGRRWMIQAVARAYQPGCQADSMLVLEGPQGARKSTSARVLCEAIDPKVFRPGFSLDGQSMQHILISLSGQFLVEWGELAGLSKQEAARVKDFMTQREDIYKLPYDRLTCKRKRTFTFIASTNEGAYLRDLTGNRRFWPVRIGRIDVSRLRNDAEQLWGEAVREFKAGKRYWLDEADVNDAPISTIAMEEQAARLMPDSWDDVALDLAEMICLGNLEIKGERRTKDGTQEFQEYRMAVGQGARIADLMSACGMDYNIVNDIAKVRRFGDALRKAGFTSYLSDGRTKWKLTEEAAEKVCPWWKGKRRGKR